MKKQNFFLFLIIILFSLFIFDKKIFAFDNFIEDFNSNYSNPGLWNVNPNQGEINFSDRSIILSSSKKSFPFIVNSQNLNLDGDFEIELSFKYGSPFNFGSGINFYTENGSIFGVWQDNVEKLRYFTNLCTDQNQNCTGTSIFYKTVNNDTNSHTIKYNYSQNKYNIYIDNQLLFTSSETNLIPKNIRIGNSYVLSTNNVWATLSIDYIHITSLGKTLNVPFYSQNDPAWGNDEYDHANGWISEYPGSEPDIDHWGCAMTSAAMVLNYFGIDVTPNNEPLNPKTLNEWLKNKVSLNNLMGNYPGYFPNGWINWNAVRQLAFFFKPDIEVKQIWNSGVSTENIDNNIPEIIQLKGINSSYWNNSSSHFVVIKGYSNDNFIINDPEDQFTILPKSYLLIDQRIILSENSNKSIKNYLTFNGSNNVNFLLTDKDGKRTGRDKQGNIYEEIPDSYYYVGSLPAGEASESAHLFQELSVSAEATPSYSLLVSSIDETDYDLSFNLLNKDNVLNGKDFLDKKIYADEEIEYEIADDIVEEVVSFNTLRKYIKEQTELGNISKDKVAKILLADLAISERMYERGKIKITKQLLDVEIKLVKAFSHKFIDHETKEELIALIKELKDNL
ncbi:C39 family peptidase [Candidatus Beckwithbacteria bacterium]|nr:C39 family peptidase [Candidatus Beckwithbacteria bacterium]